MLDGAVLSLRIALNALLMGSIPLLIQLTHASTLLIAIVRLTIGAGLSALLFRSRLALREAFRKEPRLFALLGVCFAIHWLTYFEAIRRSSGTLGVLSLSTFGIHVTWMSVLFGTRRAGWVEWVGILLSALGAIVCAPSLEDSPGLFVGFSLGMTSAVFYAMLPHLHQRLASFSHATRSVSQLGIAWLCFLPAAPFVSYSLLGSDWLILGFLGVFCTFVAHNLWISITTEVSPAMSGLLYYLAIPVTMALDWALFQRPPGTDQLLGAGLIALGNLVSRLRRPEPADDDEPG